MGKAEKFGIGLTLILLGLFALWWIHSIDPVDNTPVAMLIGSVLFCPGAILLGKVFWP